MNGNWPRALIAPHAPTMLEREMDGIDSAVNSSLTEMGGEMLSSNIDLVIAASTHWILDDFLIDPSAQHRTVYDYYGFRTTLAYDVPGHPDMAEWILNTSARDFVFPERGICGADHAVAIPMHFLFPLKNVPVVPISVGGSMEEALHRGRAIRRAVDESGYNVLFMASGSLSHDLFAFVSRINNSIYQLFDKAVMDLLVRGEGMALHDLDPALIQAGKPEGFFRDLYMLLGFIGPSSKATVHAYESLPGVGLGVLSFKGRRMESFLKEKVGGR